MNKELLEQLKDLKKILSKDGFIIDGIVGSVARGEERDNSDIDIMYHLNEVFLEQYGSFKGFKKLEEIKNFIKENLKKEVDLIPSNNLSNTAKKYMLKDLINV